MKNKSILVILLVSLVMLFPARLLAKTYYEGHETKNLVETLEAEEMKIQNKSYKETDDQAIIYLFRGQGCGYCRNFITFLNSISKDYGKYFKLVSFEVWNDSNNNDLMNKVASFTGEAAGGVPYIIIGEQVFPGYISDWDDQIKAAIKNQYDDNSYDVFEAMAKSEKEAKKAAAGYSPLVPLINIGVTVLCALVIVILQCRNHKLLVALNSRRNTQTNVSNEYVKREETIDVRRNNKKGRK